MQPKLFNSETFPAGGHGKHKNIIPTIRLHKQGGISLNIKTVELLKLQSKDKIIFIQDEDEKDEWFIAKAINSELGYEVRGKDPGKALLFNHQRLRTEIITSSKLDILATSVKLRVALLSVDIHGYTAFAIFTSSGKDNS